MMTLTIGPGITLLLVYKKDDKDNETGCMRRISVAKF